MGLMLSLVRSKALTPAIGGYIPPALFHAKLSTCPHLVLVSCHLG
jgi:hypothetical protein